uniref:Uncharacterized protein n=1 Tax=Knipowitschia caucasica TaxID=637954 RepID=A0AAV2LVU3_KNICA
MGLKLSRRLGSRPGSLRRGGGVGGSITELREDFLMGVMELELPPCFQGGSWNGVQEAGYKSLVREEFGIISGRGGAEAWNPPGLVVPVEDHDHELESSAITPFHETGSSNCPGHFLADEVVFHVDLMEAQDHPERCGVKSRNLLKISLY